MTETTAPLATSTHEVTLRMLQRDDKSKLLAFTRGLPSHDLLFLPNDITEESVVDAWIDDAVAQLAPTTVAEADGAIVGYASVAVSPERWTRHVAEIRMVVAEGWRGGGLGGRLLKDAFRIGLEMGVEKMMARMTVDQTGAMRLFKRVGFQSEAILRDHIRDREGEPHDLIILGHDTGVFLQTLGLVRGDDGYHLIVPKPIDPDEIS